MTAISAARKTGETERLLRREAELEADLATVRRELREAGREGEWPYSVAARGRDEEARFLRRMLQASGDCIKLLDLDATLRFMSEGGCALMEVDDFAAVEGRSWPDGWEGDGLLAAVAALAEARAGRTGRFEGAARTFKGTPKWWDVVVTPILGEDGGAERILVISRDITDQRRADDALMESRARLDLERGLLDAVFRQAPVGLSIAFADPARLPIINDKAARIVGHGANAGGLDRYKGFGGLHPDGRSYAPEEYPTVRALARGEVIEREELLYRRGGPEGSEDGVRRLEVSSAPVLDEAGLVVAAATIIEDVEERRLAEAQLRESEARFRNMADHAPVMMWVTDPTGSCTYLNRRWYEFTGQAEALGLGWTHATHPDDQKLAEDAFVGANAAQAPFRVEYRLRRADGVHRWAIDAASPRFGPDGAFMGYVGMVLDIDERREAELALVALTADL